MSADMLQGRLSDAKRVVPAVLAALALAWLLLFDLRMHARYFMGLGQELSPLYDWYFTLRWLPFAVPCAALACWLLSADLQALSWATARRMAGLSLISAAISGTLHVGIVSYVKWESLQPIFCGG